MEHSRRGMLGALAALAACAGNTGTPDDGDPRTARFERATGDAPWWLLAPAEQGSELAGGWVISDLSTVQRGASVLLLQHCEKGDLEVHICTHDGHPKGPVHTVLFDLIAMDGGHGHRRTDPTIRDALSELVYYIEANELIDDDALSVADRLLPHVDRVDLFGPDGL